jgi:hypothetical protein
VTFLCTGPELLAKRRSTAMAGFETKRDAMKARSDTRCGGGKSLKDEEIALDQPHEMRVLKRNFA